jgi:hypothetical protein
VLMKWSGTTSLTGNEKREKLTLSLLKYAKKQIHNEFLRKNGRKYSGNTAIRITSIIHIMQKKIFLIILVQTPHQFQDHSHTMEEVQHQVMDQLQLASHLLLPM